ncbi:MAG: hypothetical protein WAL50_21595 [Kineosporiaceae bacterium]
MRRLPRILAAMTLLGACLIGAAPAQASQAHNPKVTTIQVAGVQLVDTVGTHPAGKNPAVDTSTFGGRCSVPSAFVFDYKGTARLTGIGTVTLQGSHCTQVKMAAGTGTYTDGQITLTTSKGYVIRTTHSGSFVMVGNTSYVTGTTKVVGGTGPYRGAKGTLTEFGQGALDTGKLQMASYGTITIPVVRHH